MVNMLRTRYKYGFGVDKLTQYRWFKDNNIPALEFTTDMLEVEASIKQGELWFGRKLLNASCGTGIVVMEDACHLIPCPVYTKYKKKKREFRVHVLTHPDNGSKQVVSITEKRKRKEFEGERNTKIRNLANGYVFCQEVENVPEGLCALAISASCVSESSFAGVDIGYNEKTNSLFVIEVNSAPGIEGTNLTKYVEGIFNV